MTKTRKNYINFYLNNKQSEKLKTIMDTMKQQNSLDYGVSQSRMAKAVLLSFMDNVSGEGDT